MVGGTTVKYVIKKKYNLPFIHVRVWNDDRFIDLNNVLIDTGSASTIFKLKKMEEINYEAKKEDEFGTIFGVGGKELIYYKVIDLIEICGLKIEKFMVDIGRMNYGSNFDIDGIIGMDLLERTKASIDIEEMTITCKL